MISVKQLIVLLIRLKNSRLYSCKEYFPLSRNSPEEIVATVELRFAAEAFVGERLEAFTAADAGGVPGAFQDIQQELVQDGLVASGAGIANAHGRFTAT